MYTSNYSRVQQTRIQQLQQDSPGRMSKFNDSFDQPAEPFECDISAILPGQVSMSILSGTEDFGDDGSLYEDSFDLGPEPGASEDHPYNPSANSGQTKELTPLHPSNTHLPQGYTQEQEPHTSRPSMPTQSSPSHHLNGNSEDWTQLNKQGQLQDHYLDDEPLGDHARLSTIAELSELPSISIPATTTHLPSKTSKTGAGRLLVSRELAMEDLYVEGQEEEEEKEERVRQQLANLKPTDVLGPLHAAHDFKISSITGNSHLWERLQPHEQPPVTKEQQHAPTQTQFDSQNDQMYEEDSEQDQHSEGDSDDMLDQDSEALRREYEAMFGPNGAVDSELSGSVVGLVGYPHEEDLYPQDDSEGEGGEFDEDDDFLPDIEEDEDYEDEDEDDMFMYDMNGGNGMILGNNIPRKPRILAPAPGSKLPVLNPGMSKNVPLALVAPVVNRAPSVAARHSPNTSPTVNSPPTVSSPVQDLGSRLRPPQVSSKQTLSVHGVNNRSLNQMPTPTTPAPGPSKSILSSTSNILDGLHMDFEPVEGLPVEETSGARRARQYAAEIKAEEERQQHAAASVSNLRGPMTPTATNTATISRPSLLRPPTKVASKTLLPEVGGLVDPSAPAGQTQSGIAPPKIRTLTQPAGSVARPATGLPQSQLPGRVSSFSNHSTPRASPTGSQHFISTLTSSPQGTRSNAPSGSPSSRLPAMSTMPGSRLTRPVSLYDVHEKDRELQSMTGTPQQQPVPRMRNGMTSASSSNALNQRRSMYEQPTKDLSISDDEKSPDVEYETQLRRQHGKLGKRLSDSDAGHQQWSQSTASPKSSRRASLEEEEEEEDNQVQQGLLEIEVMKNLVRKREAELAAWKERHNGMSATPTRSTRTRVESQRPLTIHTSNPRRSLERTRENDRLSSTVTSPLSPKSPRSLISPRSADGLSSKRSSIAGLHGISRDDPRRATIEERIANMRKDIDVLRQEMHYDQSGTRGNPSASVGYATSKTPTPTTVAKAGMGNKNATRPPALVKRNSIGGIGSSRNSVPSSPEIKSLPVHPVSVSTTTRRQALGEITNKPGRGTQAIGSGASLTSKKSPPTPQSQKPSRSLSENIGRLSQRATATTTAATAAAMSPPRTDTRGNANLKHHLSLSASSSTKPSASYNAAMQRERYPSLEERYQTGSSGQSFENYDDFGRKSIHEGPVALGYESWTRPGRHPTHPQQQPYNYHQMPNMQQQQHPYDQRFRHRPSLDGAMMAEDGYFYSQQQYPLTPRQQYLHHMHHQALTFSSSSNDEEDASASAGGLNCAAEVRPSDVRFRSSASGPLRAHVTLSNRSRQKMEYEVLKPIGVHVSPPYGTVGPGREQRLEVHLDDQRGAGRVVVEVDRAWLVSFNISFDD
ncbi:hypothetical protein BGW38_003637 [Lunasporangiospora selenospora]|uniref:MSP domain-containing protein n=1 Tax=Lunasporangiospora selenospora TaxID=979761 RepID=A0A9P6FR67_9FUNG|nr:hypothetical protein BGW38_003637 [Lunasporangiospora selenospora]